MKTSKRGYGAAHQRLRKRWAVEVRTGKVRCARCGELILPRQEWDLGHDDVDRSKYSGPEHRHTRDCAAGGNRAWLSHARRPVSRVW